MPDNTPEKPIPDWVENTPQELEYSLLVYDELDGSRQEIDVTREEYMHLKNVLAHLRGYGTVSEGAGDAQRLSHLRALQEQGPDFVVGIHLDCPFGFMHKCCGGTWPPHCC